MTLDTDRFVGTWRRFGTTGPVYEVIAACPTNLGEPASVRIRVLETGEEIDYSLTNLLDDPRER